MKKSDLVAYVDGELTDAEAERVEQELTENPELITELSEICKDQMLLAEHFSENHTPTQKAPKLIPIKNTKKPLSLAIFTAVAALTLIGLFVLFPTTAQKIEVAQVISTGENISVFRNNSQKPLLKNDRLYLDDVIFTKGDDLLFVYSDNSQVVISKNSEVVLGQTNSTGKQIVLTKGSLKATVSPQPSTKQMKLITPHSESIVLGTILELYTLNMSSQLKVIEGKVRFSNSQDTQDFIEVTTGESASLTKGESILLEQALLENFSDQQEMYVKWENLDNPYSMSLENEKLKISIQNLSQDNYIERNVNTTGLGKSSDWTKGSGTGIITKQRFKPPLKVEFDYEPSTTISQSLNSIVKLESDSEKQSFWIGRRGNNIEAKWMDNEVIFSKSINSQNLEKWYVSVSKDELSFSINNQEVFRGKLSREMSTSYKVSLLVDAKRDFPQETSVYFDNVKIKSGK
ncbi:MAG: FecR domain-containing protein [Lentisphaeraceae bacterium]|nr:FecR domain-containing protein [Lentisphaeraceae bacterium]